MKEVDFPFSIFAPNWCNYGHHDPMRMAWDHSCNAWHIVAHRLGQNAHGLRQQLYTATGRAT
eukprot:6805854-Prymnesium_polylepis.1